MTDSYYSRNRQKCLEQVKAHREQNKEYYREQYKQWYFENKKSLMEKQKAYRQTRYVKPVKQEKSVKTVLETVKQSVEIVKKQEPVACNIIYVDYDFIVSWD